MTPQDQSPYALNGHGVGEGRQFQRLVSAPVKSRFLLNRAGDCRFLDLDCRILLDKNNMGDRTRWRRMMASLRTMVFLSVSPNMTEKASSPKPDKPGTTWSSRREP